MEKIAVVGISCLFPGAKDIYQFTSNIMEKRESIVDVPENRWILSPDSVVSKKFDKNADGLVVGEGTGIIVFISMRDECAGFFTDKEVKNSGGIILKNEDKEMIKNKRLFNPHVGLSLTEIDS